MRKSFATALAVASLVVLAGCAGSPESAQSAGGSAQSTEEACAIAWEKMETVGAEMDDQFSGLVSDDFEGAAATAVQVRDQIAEVAESLSNAEVREVMTDIADVWGSMEGLIDMYAEVGDDPDKAAEVAEESAAISAQMDTSTAAFEDLCGAAGDTD